MHDIESLRWRQSIYQNVNNYNGKIAENSI